MRRAAFLLGFLLLALPAAAQFNTIWGQTTGQFGIGITITGSTLTLPTVGNGTFSIGGASSLFAAVPPTGTAPLAPGLENSSVAGTIAGTYRYRVTWTTYGGREESDPGTVSSPWTPDGTHQTKIDQPASPPSWATRWKVYRTQTGPGATYYYLSSDVIGDTFILDNANDSTLTIPLAVAAESSVGRRVYVGGVPFLTALAASTGLGTNALGDNVSTGQSNTAVGGNSMALNSGGYENTAVGFNALYPNTIGYRNVAVGESSLYSNTTGVWNTAVGYAAMQSNIDGQDNTAIGDSTIFALTHGSHNTAVGFDNLSTLTTGSENTAIGGAAGWTSAPAQTGCVFLGFKAGYYETGNNKLFIDNQIRTNEADGRVKALIYGVFDAAVGNQYLTVNGTLLVNPAGLTAGSLATAPTLNGAVRGGEYRVSWTNADVVGLGANLTGSIVVATLPIDTVVKNAYVFIGTAATNVVTLTVSVGRTGAAYVDYIKASSAMAAANTVYGAVVGDRGTNLTGYDLPSHTATTAVYVQFICNANLSTVLTSTGTIVLETTRL